MLFDIRNLLPSPPKSQLDIEDEEVIVHPVRDMAFKVLTRTLVGEGVFTEHARCRPPWRCSP